MHRIKFNKARLFLIFSLILFISAGFLYSQTSTNAEVSFTNLPNSKRLASKISIKPINEDSLYVEWEGIYHPNLTYYVYRSNNPILSRPLLSTATIIGSVKATNSFNSYSMLDILPGYGKYYYAVISYVDNIGFYTADSDVDTVSFEFKDPNAINTNIIMTNTNTMIIVSTNDLNTATNFISHTNYYEHTNYYNQTNYYNFTNYYNTTEIYLKPNTNNISNNAIKNKNLKDESKTNLEYTNETLIDLSENSFEMPATNTANEFQIEYDEYMSEYNKALAQFKLGNYSTVITLLKPVSTKNVNRDLYYNINLLLGKAYKYAKQKQNALTVFRRIQSINHEEVSFWVNQVLSDL